MGPLDDASAARRAIGLFRFLRGIAELKDPPVRDVDSYLPEGEVIWLAGLSTHEAVRSTHRGDHTEPDNWLEVDKLEPLRRPDPPQELRHRLRLPGALEPDRRPELVPGRDAPVEWDEERMETIRSADPLQPVLDRWIEQVWDPWRDESAFRRPVADVYSRLFRAAERASHDPDQIEVLMGVGCLAWHPAGHAPVRRHLIVADAQIGFDDRTGRVTVGPGAEASPALELDMLDPQLRPQATRIADLEHTLDESLGKLLQSDQIADLLRQVTNILDPSAQYAPGQDKPAISQAPVVTHAPALIVRKRSTAGQVRIFDTILEDLESTATVPPGIRQLVDEDATVPDPEDPDTDFHLPLPANNEQMEIVSRVSKRPFTIVQGPPGTGKTHTIANLLSHLLAHGKRVLVTAETDRALRELRDKLPPELQTLCVSVVGTGRSDRNSLRVAIDSLANNAARFDSVGTKRQIDEARGHIERLQSETTRLTDRLVEIRGGETSNHQCGDYTGTLAQIANQREHDRSRLGWIAGFDPDVRTADPPLSAGELTQLRRLRRDQRLSREEPAARQRLPDPAQLPSPAQLHQTITSETAARQVVEDSAILVSHPAFDALRSINQSHRVEISGVMAVVAANARSLAGRHEEWISDALTDLYRARPHQWTSRRDALVEQANMLDPVLAGLPLQTRVRQVGATPRGQLRRQAVGLAAHLAGGGKLKGFLGFVPGPVKDAAALRSEVTVNDLPPDTTETCDLVDRWMYVQDGLDAMDRLWPDGMAVPRFSTPHERLAWHRAELHVLDSVLELGGQIGDARAVLARHDIPQPDWHDLDAVSAYADVVDAADARETLRAASGPLDALVERLRAERVNAGASPLFDKLLEAVEARDGRAYAELHQESAHLGEQRNKLDQRDELDRRLRRQVPTLADLIRDEPDNDRLDAMCPDWEEAWQWARVAEWVSDTIASDAEQVHQRLREIEQELQRRNGELAQALAWQSAIDRLDARQQSNLRAYAIAANKVPKTRTAKTRPQRLRDAQRALRKCREAVPSWVMPLYRIAESMDISRNAFDVIIIDEASQADTGASFLQYLAPQIVVVGDDKQVSPTVVGIDDGNVQRLRRNHLSEMPHEAVWADASASYFEVCDVYFSDRITLREHFRCMPEIIGFSNEIAYQPDGRPLIPLKQFGAGRLPPVRTEFVPGAWEDRQTNHAEVTRVADIVERLVADPAYDGKSIGVITLVGNKQHRLIEAELLGRLEPEEYRARDLRCGQPPDFQGSERDIIILSMVSAPKDSGRMPVARTTTSAMQRYNVAASRAREQLWVVHSVRHTELKNQEDLRYRLLAYCDHVSSAGADEEGIEAPVPSDRLIQPFGNLFEQRGCNAILQHGYRVRPKYELYGHWLDLVVMGDGAKLAIECDGDTWMGPDAFRADLEVQHQLERCGWPVHRVRASLFSIEPAAALQPVLASLKEHGIQPAGTPTRQPSEQSDGSDDPDRGQDVGGAEGDPTQVGGAERDVSGSATSTGTVPAADEIRSAPEPASVTSRPTDSPPRPPMQVPPPPVDPGPSSVGDERTVVAEPEPGRDDLGTDGSAEGIAAVVPDPIPAEDERLGELVDDTPDPAVAPDESAMSPYEVWAASTPVQAARDASKDEIVSVLVDIVDTEGPIVGDRMYQLYVRDSGGKRVDGNAKRALNSASSRAERLGLLVGEDPLGLGGQKGRTFRLPDQPPVRARVLGDRAGLHHVPPREIRVVIDRFRAEGLIGQALHRAVLEEYGLDRDADEVADLLRSIETASFE